MKRLYRLLLRLYPGDFRREFEEQMFLDFLDMAGDAAKKGRRAYVLFWLHELVDYPFSLLSVHLKQGSIGKALRSLPMQYGFRGAAVFSVASFLAFMIGNFISWKLDASSNSPIAYLQVYFYDMFHTEQGLELIAWLSPALSSLITGLLFGLSLTILFADRSRNLRFIIAGMCGWFLHSEVPGILWYSANLVFFLGSQHYFYLCIALGSLSGAFLGLSVMVARSEKKGLIRSLAVGSIAFPLIAYWYVKLLFRLSIIETPWMFVALLFLLVIFMASVLFAAAKSGNQLRIPWIVVSSAVGYPLIPYVGRFIPLHLLPTLQMPNVLYLTDPVYWQYTFFMAVQQAIYMVPFGLLIGLALGFLKTTLRPQT